MPVNSAPSSATPQAEKKGLNRIIRVATLGGLLFGLDTGVISGALLYMREDLNLDTLQSGIVVMSLLFPGAALGALLGGPLADRVGRKRTLLVCAVVFFVGAIGCTVAPTVTLLVVARIVLGFGVGCASVTCPVYLAELAPPERRARVVTINELMIVVGIFLAFVTNVALDALIDHVSVWRYMLGIAAVPAIALFIGMFFLPDTPRWYASKGRLGDARSTLATLRDDRAAEAEYREIVELVDQDRKDSAASGGAMRLLRANPWMRRILWIGIVLAITQQTTGTNVVNYYTPTVLADSGMAESASLIASLVVGVELIVMTLVGIWLLGFTPRRRMMAIGYSGVTISHVALALAYLLPQSDFRSYLILGLLLCVSASMTGFLGTTAWLVLSEIFPLPVRGFAMGLAIAALWTTNALVSLLFPIAAGGIGSSATFAIFAVLNLAALFFARRYVPETMGRTLEEIETEMRGARGPSHTCTETPTAP